jgi:cytochrome P450
MFMPFIPPRWLPTAHNRRKQAAIKLLNDLIWSHIRARRAATAPGEDLLGMLLSAVDEEGDGSMLSDREVRDQMSTIFLAGHETTASGVTWAGWVLASHPDVAARAAAEVDEVLGGRVPVFEDIARLPYLGAVIKETLRLHSPAVGTFLRTPVEDVRIGEWLIPKGSLVSILSFVPQTDARWFAEPQRFDPARFLGDAAKHIERGAYIPFGTGPRVCIGSSFAAMEMTLILATLLQRFTLRPAPGQGEPENRVQVTLRPKGGLQLVLEPRAVLPAGAPAARATSVAASCPFH